MVCKLLKSIYGLKASPLNWFLKLRATLLDYGLQACLSDNCIFYSKNLIVGVYVDDLIVLFDTDETFEDFLAYLSCKLNVVDKGEIDKCLSMAIDYDHKQGVLTINQREYIETVLRQFEMFDCKPVPSPIAPGTTFDLAAPLFENIQWFQQLVGCLLYLANCCRPDISFAVNLLCRAMSKPTIEHVALAKRILRYLKGSIDRKLTYARAEKENLQIEVYADADFGNVVNENWSISGVMAFIGGCLVDWTCKRQSTIATSTCEAEVNALLESVNESEFIDGLLQELGLREKFGGSILVFNDNASARLASISGGKFGAGRHYRLKLGRVREALREELITLTYLPSQQMKADLLTKAFTAKRLQELLELCGI